MNIKRLLLCTSVALAGVSVSTTSSAKANPYIGEMMEVGFNFCPRGWASTEGQLQAISQNTALFSLLGTTFGGDGRTTFGLPDLRGRASVADGRGAGLQNYRLGSRQGQESVTLTLNNLPSHAHQAGVRSVTAAPDTASPAGASFTVLPGDAYNRSVDPGPIGSQPNFLNPQTVQMTSSGGQQPMQNMMPALGVRTCISLFGVFPSRN